MKVWVVDDDQAICSMLKALLTAKGYEVDTYRDPTVTPILQDQEASCPADAMLIDYFMPNMNGLEFLKWMEIHGCDVNQGNKAIITAHYSPELGRELDRLGVSYFKKPFKLPEIVRWLETCAKGLNTPSTE